MIIFLTFKHHKQKILNNKFFFRFLKIPGNQLNHFSINPLNGEIYVIKQLDYEQVKFYRLMIRAQVSDFNSFKIFDLSSKAKIFLNIKRIPVHRQKRMSQTC